MAKESKEEIFSCSHSKTRHYQRALFLNSVSSKIMSQRESERLKSQECQKVFSSEDLSSEDKTYERIIFMKTS